MSPFNYELSEDEQSLTMRFKTDTLSSKSDVTFYLFNAIMFLSINLQITSKLIWPF